MAGTIPVAQDITAEADSGGHTDNRPAFALLPTILALRDRLQKEHAYERPLRVGAAGGVSTPHSAAAAFAMGAAYVLTGSINQGCREAGTSDTVRKMLAEVEQADVRMAPAADMFEMGIKVQVLTRGSMFAMRAQKLYDVYTSCASLDAIPEGQRGTLEGTIFRAPLEEIWTQTREFWLKRDPGQVERAERDPKHQMALVFRWYLGQSSSWANAGVEDRKVDYQVWCGPAMGSFNEWVRGTWIENWENRRVVPIAHNILRGAAVLTRASALRHQGVAVDPNCLDLAPREPAELEECLT
jgi:PfaD family protein